jgi:hypothetical protein
VTKAVRYDEAMFPKSGPARPGSPHWLVFAIRLPFDVPVPDRAGFLMRKSRDVDDPRWVDLSIHRVGIELAAASLNPYERGLAVLLGEEPDLSQGSSRQTWVLARTLNVLFADEPRETAYTEAGFVTIAFERCLRAVNLLTETSRLTTWEFDSRPLTKDSLDPLLSWYRVDEDTDGLGTARQMMLHNRPYNPGFVVTQEQEVYKDLVEAISLRLATEDLGHPHPLLVAGSLERLAWGHRRRGDALSAVIVLQSAVEGLLRGVHRLLLVDRGCASTEVDIKTSVPFATLLSSHLPELLGGDWTSASSAVSFYVSKLYGLRNATMHSGHEPEWFEVNPAFDAFDGLGSFVRERISKKWRQHPRTLVAMSERWAGGDGKLPKAARSLAGSLRMEPAPYWVPFDKAGRLKTASR